MLFVEHEMKMQAEQLISAEPLYYKGSAFCRIKHLK